MDVVGMEDRFVGDVKDLALIWVKFHLVLNLPLLECIQILLQGDRAGWGENVSITMTVIGKETEDSSRRKVLVDIDDQKR